MQGSRSLLEDSDAGLGPSMGWEALECPAKVYTRLYIVDWV